MPDVYETSIGFRPNRFQLVKIDYERQNGPATPGALGNVFALQLVTRLLASRSHAQLTHFFRGQIDRGQPAAAAPRLFYTKYLN